MNIKTHFTEKLSKLLFLEIKKGSNLFNFPMQENVYMPIRSTQMVQGIQNGETFEQIPLSLLIEGMVYVLGADDQFRYSTIYIDVIHKVPHAIEIIKKIIFEEIKKEAYEEAYIMLRGLLKIEVNKENYSKAMLLLEQLRLQNSIYEEEAIAVLQQAKSQWDYAEPYAYEAFIYRDQKKYEEALFCIHQFLAKEGEQTVEIIELKQDLERVTSYAKGKELVFEQPKEALAKLLPLQEEMGNHAEIYYYIAIAYRNLQNYEKAIYYLNEAAALDADLIEVINEFGINHACLENYELAVQYFRKAFEVTRSVEICTNIIMCYLNLGNLEQAKLHLEIAKKLDAKDEIVLELQTIIEGEK